MTMLPPMILDDARGYIGQVRVVLALAIDRGCMVDVPAEDADLDDWDAAEVYATAHLLEFVPEGHWVGWDDGSWGVRELEADPEDDLAAQDEELSAHGDDFGGETFSQYGRVNDAGERGM